MTEITIVPVERLELALAPRPWPFADERRAEIVAHFDALQRSNPALWNGRVLMLHQHAIKGAVFHGAYFETDFASMLAWRQWDVAGSRREELFCHGGAARQRRRLPPRRHGRAYLESGSYLFSRRTAGLERCRRRPCRPRAATSCARLARRPGLRPPTSKRKPGWITVLAGPRIAQVKTLHARETAAVLRARILAHLARQAQPELADIRIVRGPADFDPMMPPFVTAFLTHVWSQASEEAS